jgi:hypothetical protein
VSFFFFSAVRLKLLEKKKQSCPFFCIPPARPAGKLCRDTRPAARPPGPTGGRAAGRQDFLIRPAFLFFVRPGGNKKK